MSAEKIKLYRALGSVKAAVYELEGGRFLVTTRNVASLKRAASVLEASGLKTSASPHTRGAFVAWWPTVCLLFLALFLFASAAAPVLAAEYVADPYVEQLLVDGGGNIRTLDELEAVVANVLINIILFLQRISPLIALAGVLVGIGLLFLGGIFGSRSLRAVGVSGILTSIGAYLLIRNAPAIILAIQNLRLS